MGVSYSAAIVVGLPYDEFPDKEQLEDWAEVGKLCRYSPSYDAPDKYCLFGLPAPAYVESGFLQVLIADMTANLFEQRREFTKLTGLEGRTYLTTDSY